MKKSIRILSVACIVILLCLAITACNKGKTYTFTETKVECDNVAMKEQLDKIGIAKTYDTMFKDGTLTVSGNTIILTVSNGNGKSVQKIACEKKDNVYPLTESEMEKINNMLGSNSLTSGSETKVYFVEVDGGIDYVIDVTLQGYNVKYVMSYVE